jgi:hypothetical protein
VGFAFELSTVFCPTPVEKSAKTWQGAEQGFARHSSGGWRSPRGAESTGEGAGAQPIAPAIPRPLIGAKKQNIGSQ